MSADPVLSEKVLAMLRECGWETGCAKLEASFRATGDETEGMARELLLGWLAMERGAYDQAVARFQVMARTPLLAGWANLAQAFVAMRQKEARQARQFLNLADEHAKADDILGATIAHVRGALLLHEGKAEEALPLLRQALAGFGTDHFGTGRILDTFGMLYAGKGNFHAAQEFFAEALRCKERHGDEAGLAVTHGQLGRLYLDWGLLDRAEHHFNEDLQIAQRIDDERGQAQMYNFLSRVAFARREDEEAAGRQAAAQRHGENAEGWLEASIRLSAQRGWAALEGFARKDRALAALADHDTAQAEEQLRRAEELFGRLEFEEGLAHVRRTCAILERSRLQWDAALVLLRAAQKHFMNTDEPAEVARTLLEIARVHRDAKAPRPLVTQAYLTALQHAEACRRSRLVRAIERELRAVDGEVYYLRVYRRLSGGASGEETSSLMNGVSEPATVLYLDLIGSSTYAKARDPGEVALTLNQMMADLAVVLRKHGCGVNAFRGDGFLALVRGPNHAFRGVSAGLELVQALEGFNEPRTILRLCPFQARIGIATGEVFLGNIGTYDKMAFTAVGTTANLGARLEAAAEPGLPCISRETYDAVGERFRYKETNPRTIQVKGISRQPVWDVVGLAPR